MKYRKVSTRMLIVVTGLIILFTSKVFAKPISNILKIAYTVNPSLESIVPLTSFNSSTAEGVKTALTQFNYKVSSKSPADLAAFQNPIDSYYMANNIGTINLMNLVSLYNSLSPNGERDAAISKIYNLRKKLDKGVFLHYYQGKNALLPIYSEAVNVIKALNGKLINLMWNDTESADITKSYTVKQDENVTIVLKAKLADKDIGEFGIKSKYTMSFIDAATSTPVSKDIVNGVDLNGVKVIKEFHYVNSDELISVTITFNKAGTYLITAHAER